MTGVPEIVSSKRHARVRVFLRGKRTLILDLSPDIQSEQYIDDFVETLLACEQVNEVEWYFAGKDRS